MPRASKQMPDWEPSATLETLKRRAQLIAGVRAFFYEQGVLEVDVPCLVKTAVTDVNVESFTVLSVVNKTAPAYYLATSPEYYLKRLLSSGSGPIYSLCKVFRDEPDGRFHQPEFTLLEWYRPGFDEQMLMDEMLALLRQFNPDWSAERISYGDLFENTLGFDPHSAPIEVLRDCAHRFIDLHDDEKWGRDDYLDLLMSHLFQPQMQGLVFVYDYPESQAALARLTDDEKGRRVARRFELYCDGVELANGYYELKDSKEQKKRFLRDNRQRKERGLPTHSIDGELLAALDAGLPDCSGVAMGVERLLMALLQKEDIGEVVAFALHRQ
ncbi:MAG: EF-P lysine aminoacylase GenX [Pseudomonadales bacterium]|nr:EF-P lysine aminoacylase GenX [Pseudomonadales bacterium]